MRAFKFIKSYFFYILAAVEFFVLLVWSINIISEREAQANVTPGDVVSETLLYCENNEPEDIN